MICSKCNAAQDADARFCSECGSSLAVQHKNRNAYNYALLLLPIIILACGIGYYKFFLPRGIAAVVNGEEITRTELEQEISRIGGVNGEADARLRYEALNRLIVERVMMQEARRTETGVSREELAAALADIRTRSGLDRERFNHQAERQYGSIARFEETVRRRLAINKYIAEHVVPAGADRQTALRAVEQWKQNVTDAAVVRVTLGEQWSGAGCGCADRNMAGTPAAYGCRMSDAGRRLAKNDAAPSQEAANKSMAAEAGLAYWREKHGSDIVTARVTDFGCHMQVDIMKDNKTIGSLRYQAGRISE